MASQDLKHLSSSEFVAGKPPDEQNKHLQDFVSPHIDSFNYVLDNGLKTAVQLIPPQHFELPDGRRAEIRFLNADIGHPMVDEKDVTSKTTRIYPAECRERHCTYGANLTATVQWKIGDQVQGHTSRVLGKVPMMVKSSHCSLHGLTPKELIRQHEEAQEMGGYFIINGIERIIRMLIMPRRNYPLAMVRNSWKQRGPLFTEFGVSIRSVQKDQTGNTSVLHYLNDGTCTFSFIHGKEQFFIPLAIVLKALTPNTDQYVYTNLIKGQEENVFFKDAVANMLRVLQNEGLLTRKEVLKYIGERFRIKFSLAEWVTDEEVAIYLFNNCILPHLDNNQDKFNLLVFMTQKLFDLANEKCAVETPDNPMNQEVLLGGHVFQTVLKDKLETWLTSLRYGLLRGMKKMGNEFELNQATLLSWMQKTINVSNAVEHFFSTGNISSKSSLGLMQNTGLTVVADKLNIMRFLSHFRCIHRGAFFAQMRTTGVRKLLPEAWGFMCPVHTPDGSPCGLLNHLAALCKVENEIRPTATLRKMLLTLGVYPENQASKLPNLSDCYTVLLDGDVVGRIHRNRAEDLAAQLRYFKASGKEGIPSTMEICLIQKTKYAGQYPGLFLFTEPARMIRPVTNLRTKTVEYIGSFEQVYMDIAVCKKEIIKNVTTHLELGPSSMLSALANLTPYSDFNQSPRNMYQCQMGKQTMGTPCQALKHRSDNKMYRIQTPQAPIVRNERYNDYGVDEFPLGTNAVVAVISYTGYDMEDAMIINKGSLDRGFSHGQIYKTEVINLVEKKGRTSTTRFGADPKSGPVINGKIDLDGLPLIGRYMQQDEPYYSYYNTANQQYTVKKYKSMEPAYIEDVKILGNNLGDGKMDRVSIKLRIRRNPIIGDKFASRHGQKGILSQKWPVHDMPFTESGMVPDILFNPHGFPSRMTIGMMIESMAGKSAALHGITHDSTPFKFSEDDPAADYMGDMLLKAGYNYYGNETLYSGINGQEMGVSIFVGIVYYQRLRHMVSDKFQVRTTGPIDVLTHQPVKGRKRHGGIRFGEMERDALIAHGSGFLLHDRLFNCSDKSETHVCTKCGSLISPTFVKIPEELAKISCDKNQWICKTCENGDHITKMVVPYVFRYLLAELTAMNIRVTLDVK